MMDNEDLKDVLLAFMHEYYSRLQQYEKQRSTVSNLLVIIAAAILAFVTFDKALTIADLPLTVLLFVIGLFGAAFCAKYYERSARYFDRLKAIREELDSKLFDSHLLTRLRDEAEQKHEADFPRLYGGKFSWVKIYRLWIIFHLFIALLGLILTVLIRYL